ncbi:GNAT family N-acetyltransferase [Ureibacillus sp. 179-F W5.1 NHS]|uniref:GNAT family N-acetyltransferase n=1 Tax=Lysinibacillus halotolerans TaxID=1368476 RepID=A0A3M8H5X9_9BACI|nr:GNAT family N-acetyltransferase [Lysinibacillus halotolerans]RNC97825.1 GNAT family N-acetyltransferase [Lysinibacillus halotolerans]
MYRNEQWLFDNGKPVKIIVRNYTKEDFDELIDIQAECFPPPFPSALWWNKEQLTNHVSLFPDGALCIEMNGKVVSSMTGVCINFDPSHPSHTWAEATDDGYIRNHDQKGNTLYIVDISVRPSFRSLGLGKIMMQAMYQVVVEKGFERLLGGGRMPNYYKYADLYSANEYVERVVNGEIHDPVISFLLRCGRLPIAVVENYLEDEESLHYGVLMEWKNPFKQLN